MSDIEGQVRRLLSRTDSSGAPLYSDDEVRDVLPLICFGLSRASGDLEIPDFAVACVGEVAAKAGVDPKASPDEVLEKLEAYYRAHPSPLALELELILRAAVGQGAGDAARRAAALVGTEVKLEPLASGVRPEGTIPAGPGARFAVSDQFPSPFYR